MESFTLRKKFLNFFKKNGHKIISSSSLIPSDDSVLFTTAGMQQFSLYLAGDKDIEQDLKIRHLTSCQKCFRGNDINEIGDDSHHTFFEMLGNWSIGQDKKGNYFKEGAICLALEFLRYELKIPDSKLWITVFKGEEDIPKDEASIKFWIKQGIPKKRIREFGREDNFWGPVGEIGICGPCSEIHYDRGEEFGCGKSDCGPNCLRCQRFVEIWNLVFMEYDKKLKTKKLKNNKTQERFYEYVFLPQKSVDTGMGFERVLAILENKQSAYETDLFQSIIQEIGNQSLKSYNKEKKIFRIIADHIRGAVFLISEGVLPSNLGQGYILRRLLRRSIRYAMILEAESGFLIPLANKTIDIYKDVYPDLLSNQKDILIVIQKEEEKFKKTLEKGLKELKNISVLKEKKERLKGYIRKEDMEIVDFKKNAKEIGKTLFFIYQSYGFPLELSLEELETILDSVIVNKEEIEKIFYEELKKHQEISRAGKEKKFGGIGKKAGYKAMKLHTATHLLHASLREILGSSIKQMGSDINEERLRFDFSFDRKLTEQEIKRIECLVNQKIKDNLEIKKQEVFLSQALKSGALAFFKEKYPEKVFVYSIDQFSKEICAGPHVKNTNILGYFNIIKEESSGAGIRRIKAILK